MDESIKFESLQGVKSHTQKWYKILQLLGSGGNADAFLVLSTSNPSHGSLFAMKIFRRLSMFQRRNRLFTEIRFLMNCEHPSITPIYDYGLFHYISNRIDYELPFLITTYQPTTLRDIVRYNNATKVEKVTYTMQLLSAITYLSQQSPQVVHRDIKPENIFVNGPSCMLGDFGLIKTVDANENPEDPAFLQESQGPGMPFFYRTPDLVKYVRDGTPLTPKSDVFQLGLIAAELFTGRNPERRAENILDDLHLDPIAHILGHQGRAIKQVIERMLIKNPDERENAQEFLDSWQGIMENLAREMNNLEGRVFPKRWH